VYAACFDDAERRVKDIPVLQARVRATRMPLMYVQLVTRCGPTADPQALLETFHGLCRENGNPPGALCARVRKQNDRELLQPTPTSHPIGFQRPCPLRRPR